MTTAYLDPVSGVSGDMFLGALVDIGVPLADLQSAVAGLRVPGLTLSARTVRRAGIEATKVSVEYPAQPARHLDDLVALIQGSGLARPVVAGAIGVFERLAEAEAAVHGIPAREVHFHEVGAADALADVVGTVFGLHALGVDELIVGSVNVGSGTVACAHGVLPVPAPATAQLLRGWACYAAGPSRELTTPTGAALVTGLGRQVVPLPRLRVDSVGHGAADSDPPGWANVLRLVLGAAESD